MRYCGIFAGAAPLSRIHNPWDTFDYKWPDPPGAYRSTLPGQTAPSHRAEYPKAPYTGQYEPRKYGQSVPFYGIHNWQWSFYSGCRKLHSRFWQTSQQSCSQALSIPHAVPSQMADSPHRQRPENLETYLFHSFFCSPLQTNLVRCFYSSQFDWFCQGSAISKLSRLFFWHNPEFHGRITNRHLNQDINHIGQGRNHSR